MTQLNVSHEIMSRDVALMALYEKFSFRPVLVKKKESKEHSLAVVVNDSPGILYYDNKRPLRKAGSRCSVHVTRTSCAVSISLSLFSLSR